MDFDDIDTPIPDSELYGGEPDTAPATDAAPGGEDVVKNDVATETDPAETAEPATAETTDNPEASSDAADTETKRSETIPRARFDEVNSRLHAEREARKRLEDEITALKSKSAEAATVDIEALEAEAFEATIEGNKERVIELRKQINAAIKDQTQREFEAQRREKEDAKNAQSAFETAAADIWAKYPYLDHTNDAQSNPEAIAEVVEWRDFYINRGQSPVEALQNAVAKVTPLYTPVQAPAPVVTDGRRQAALARNVAASGAQPPAQVAGIGNRAAPPKPRVESQDDWEKLSETERESLLM